MIFPAATPDAQLLRFWRGDRILRIEQTARRRIGSTAFSTIRIPRQDRPDIEEAIVDDLAASLANAHRNE